MSADRQCSFKARPIGGREERRQELLARQKAARRDLTNHARNLVKTFVSDSKDISKEFKAQQEPASMDDEKVLPFALVACNATRPPATRAHV